MSLLLSFLFLVCFLSCRHKTERVVLHNAFGMIVADTSSEASRFMQTGDGCADYPVYYIGPAADTIKIGKRYSMESIRWVDDFSTPFSKEYSARTLEITVDTSVKTSSILEFSVGETENGMKQTLHYHSFLFSIKNISGSKIYVGPGFSVFFIHREAKNRNGDWVRIDQKLSEMNICRTGAPTISLRPNEFLVSKLKRYQGAFVTDFRLVFGTDDRMVYSNVFRDAIDEKMLPIDSADW